MNPRASFSFAIDHYDPGGPARVGTMMTPHGPVETPAFMPVGTRGVVKTLTGREVWLTGARIQLANTYHLMLRPGAEVVSQLGGVHAISGFPGPMLTDSGGFQAFSLAARLDDDGMTLPSVYDGSTVRLTPEETMRVERLLGADIAMVLDDCPALPADPDRVAAAVARTTTWARRCRDVHSGDTATGEAQALFGIVQGGTDPALRTRSAADIVGIGFDGYAIGGLSVGETYDEMVATLSTLEPQMPLDNPRYLMGVGDPARLLAAVELGVDLFDSVWPTRLARHGQIPHAHGRFSLKSAAHEGSDMPLEAGCVCAACRTTSRGALRHLFMVHEPLAPRLLSIHNLSFLGKFMARLRAAIRAGRLADEAAVIRSELSGPSEPPG